MKEKRKFRDWFENVFWYHYKWWFLIGVFVVAVIVFITVESATMTDYDMTIVFGQSGNVTEEDVADILDTVGDAVGDLNGDGEVHIGFISVPLGDTDTDTSSAASSGATMRDRMLLYMSDESYVLYFLEDAYSASYIALGYFEDDLSGYGIDVPADDPYRVYVGDTGLFGKFTEAAQAQLPEESATEAEGIGYYASIIDWTTVGRGSQEATDAAVAALQAILNS